MKTKYKENSLKRKTTVNKKAYTQKDENENEIKNNNHNNHNKINKLPCLREPLIY